MKIRVHNGVEVTILAINNNDVHMEVNESLIFLNQYEKEQLLDAMAIETIKGKGMEVNNALKETTQIELINVPREPTREEINAEMAISIYKGEKEL